MSDDNLLCADSWPGTIHSVLIFGGPAKDEQDSKQTSTQMYILVAWSLDNQPVKVEVILEKPSETVSGFLSVTAKMLTDLLLRGCSVEDIEQQYRGYRFEPSGFTSNRDIRTTTSPVDYLVRWLLLARNSRLETKNLAGISSQERTVSI